jgi:hypothetical protein
VAKDRTEQEVMWVELGQDLALRPAREYDAQVLKQYSVGKRLRCRLTQPRSGRQQRFYWAMLRHLLPHQSHYFTVESLHRGIKLKLGLVEEVHLHDGAVWTVEASTSYDAMDGSRFQEHINATIDLFITEIAPSMDREAANALLADIEEMIGP